MSWAVGYDPSWRRDIGYGVPATCDHPGCGARIDRGLSHVCGGDVRGGEHGCGLYFCEQHLSRDFQEGRESPPLCDRCHDGSDPFDATPDLDEWTTHKATDPSWAKWRAEQGIPEPGKPGELARGGIVHGQGITTELDPVELVVPLRNPDEEFTATRILVARMRAEHRRHCRWCSGHHEPESPEASQMHREYHRRQMARRRRRRQR